MSDELLPPLSDEAASVLDAERLCPGPPAAIRARILERVAATAAPPLAPPTSPDASPAAGTAAAAATAGGGAGLLIKAGLIFVVGVGVGVGGTLVVQGTRSAVPATPSQRPSLPAEPAPAATAVPVALRVATPAAVAVAPPSTRASASGNGGRKRVRPVAVPVEATAESLAAERRLVEMARTALGRTRPSQALDALAQHRKRFLRGQLAEERDALTVLALIASSEGEKARDQAQQFRDRYPSSLLLPAIEAALAEEKRRSE